MAPQKASRFGVVREWSARDEDRAVFLAGVALGLLVGSVAEAARVLATAFRGKRRLWAAAASLAPAAAMRRAGEEYGSDTLRVLGAYGEVVEAQTGHGPPAVPVARAAAGEVHARQAARLDSRLRMYLDLIEAVPVVYMLPLIGLAMGNMAAGWAAPLAAVAIYAAMWAMSPPLYPLPPLPALLAGTAGAVAATVLGWPGAAFAVAAAPFAYMWRGYRRVERYIRDIPLVARAALEALRVQEPVHVALARLRSPLAHALLGRERPVRSDPYLVGVLLLRVGDYGAEALDVAAGYYDRLIGEVIVPYMGRARMVGGMAYALGLGMAVMLLWAHAQLAPIAGLTAAASQYAVLSIPPAGEVAQVAAAIAASAAWALLPASPRLTALAVPTYTAVSLLGTML